MQYQSENQLQNGIITFILKFVAILGLLALVPSVYLAVRDKVWVVAFLDVAFYLYMIIIAYHKKAPLGLKKISLIGMTYVLGTVLQIYTGPFGASTIYLFAFAFLVSLFYSAKITVFANVLNAVTFTSLSVLSNFGIFDWEQSLGSSLIIMVNFILICGILSLTTQMLMNGFRNFIKQEKELRQQVQEEIQEKEEEKRKVEKGLETKDILLKELHHRVKNNLQIITSLINLHLYRKQDYKVGLEGVRDRVRAISMVHRLLYTWEDEATVKLEEILSSTLDYIRESLPMTNITIEKDIKLKNLSLNADKATLIALILNEVLTNAIKHAFPAEKKGRIMITMLQEDRTLYLGVDDNGIGFDMEKDKNDESLGLDLVKVISSQLAAEYKIFSSREGTTFFLEIPLEIVENRPKED